MHDIVSNMSLLVSPYCLYVVFYFYVHYIKLVNDTSKKKDKIR